MDKEIEMLSNETGRDPIDIELERLRAENATLREALRSHGEKAAKWVSAEPVAWMVKSKRGLIRACWSENPSDEQVEVAHIDGDTITPLYAAPKPE